MSSAHELLKSLHPPRPRANASSSLCRAPPLQHWAHLGSANPVEPPETGDSEEKRHSPPALKRLNHLLGTELACKPQSIPRKGQSCLSHSRAALPAKQSDWSSANAQAVEGMNTDPSHLWRTSRCQRPNWSSHILFCEVGLIPILQLTTLRRRQTCRPDRGRAADV